MMFMPSTLLFFLVLGFSVMLVISSPTWFGAWVGLEVNLMSFIPVILDRRNMLSVECCLKYFLVQAFSSLMLLMSLLIMMGDLTQVWMVSGLGTFGSLAALLIKLGAAPFHFWFPAVSGGIGWGQNFLLMTLQKLGPMVLIGYTMTMSYGLLLVILLSTAIGGLGGLNQVSLRKLMAYSSINHVGWMLSACLLGYKYFFIYFVIYFFTNGMLVYTLSLFNFFYLSQLFYYTPSGLFTLIIYTNWLSFGGLPPFIGFFPKWVVVENLASSGLYTLVIFMVFMSLVSLFYYTRVCYVSFTQAQSVNTISFTKSSSSWSVPFVSLFFLLMLFFVPFLVPYM